MVFLLLYRYHITLRGCCISTEFNRLKYVSILEVVLILEAVIYRGASIRVRNACKRCPYVRNVLLNKNVLILIKHSSNRL